MFSVYTTLKSWAWPGDQARLAQYSPYPWGGEYIIYALGFGIDGQFADKLDLIAHQRYLYVVQGPNNIARFYSHSVGDL